MDPFRPFDDKPSMRGYYEVPPQVYEQTPQLQAWARRAVEAAKAKKKPARRARKRSQ
jgi:DNA transformation protein